jgi:hypothetical protein
MRTPESDAAWKAMRHPLVIVSVIEKSRRCIQQSPTIVTY